MPTVLSRAQQQVLVSAAAAPLTLVVGPPGTGKSYTIAAAAVDHLSRGESVLIACRKHQAIDVIAEMIDDLLGHNQCVIRGGQQQRQRELKAFLEHILQGIRIRIQGSAGESDVDNDAPDRELKALDKKIVDLERDITRHFNDEVSWGRLTAGEGRGFFRRALCRWKLHWVTRRLDKRAAVWKRIQQYESFLRESELLTRKLLKARIDARMELSLKRHRRDLTKFLRSLRTRSSTRQQALFSQIDPHILFGTFPIWLTSISDASEIVPLQTAVFDVAIFDEATQCDIASCIPILQRAKRAVVVGDPNQLRHVSFLANDRLRRLSQDHGLVVNPWASYHRSVIRLT